jgi:ABC-type amino acid transport substrate-binding protein
MRPTLARAAIAAVTLSLAAAACSSTSSGETSGGSTSPAGDPNTDKLAHILDRGTLIVSLDPAYPPQSFLVEGAERAAPTRCSSEQLTAPEVDGYDSETAKLVAAELGVEPCWITPTWVEITGGNWGDRWDISWGSGGINEDRMTRLYMTQPYYSAPQSFFVHEDSDHQTPSDLDGKEIGVCASCSHQLYLEGTLEVPGTEIEYKVEDPEIVVYQTEPPGLQDVADGEIDAFMLSAPVGRAAIADGLPLREIEEPGFLLDLTAFLDQSSGLDQRAFFDRINAIVLELLNDGSLPALSEEFFGTDYASAAAEYDIDALGQEVT